MELLAHRAGLCADITEGSRVAAELYILTSDTGPVFTWLAQDQSSHGFHAPQHPTLRIRNPQRSPKPSASGLVPSNLMEWVWPEPPAPAPPPRPAPKRPAPRDPPL